MQTQCLRYPNVFNADAYTSCVRYFVLEGNIGVRRQGVKIATVTVSLERMAFVRWHPFAAHIKYYLPLESRTTLSMNCRFLAIP